MSTNAYYEPEKIGLAIVAEIEYTDGCYQFDTRVIWRHVETGKLYTARDSGCSCPTPFENYDCVESLEPFDYETIHREVIEVLGDKYSDLKPETALPFLEILRGLK